MAERIEVTFKADTSQFRQGVKRARVTFTNNMKAAERAAKVSSKNIKKATNKVGEKTFGNLNKNTLAAKLSIDNLKKSAINMVGAFVAIQAIKNLFSNVITQTAEFSKALGEVSTLVDSSIVSNKELAKTIRELSTEFGVGTTEVAKGLYQAISAGAIAGSEANNLLRVALDTARGGVTTVEVAVDGLTTIINAFGFEMSDAQKVSDVLFSTMKQGKTTLEKLSRFFFQAAPLAAKLGVSFEEVSAAIVTMTKQGTPSRVAFSAIRASMQSLLRPSEELDKIFEKVGGTAASFKKLGLAKTFDILLKGVSGNIGQLIKLVGSIEGAQAILQLTGKNARGFAKALDNIKNSAGATQEASKKMAKTIDNILNKAIQEAKGSFVELGNVLLPVIKAGAKAVASFFKSIATFAKDNAELIRTVTSGFGTLVSIIKGFISLKLSSFFKTMGLAINAVKVGVDGIRSVFKGPIGSAVLKALTFSFLDVKDKATQVNDSIKQVAETLRSFSSLQAAVTDKDLLSGLSVEAKQTAIELERTLQVAKVFALEFPALFAKTREEVAKLATEFTTTVNKIAAEEIRLKLLKGQLDNAEKQAKRDVEKETIRVKIESLKKIEQETKTSLAKNVQAEQDATNKIKDINEQIRLSKLSIEDQLRTIKRRGLSESEKQADIEKELATKVVQARKALEEGDSKKVIELAKSIKGLAVQLKNNDKATLFTVASGNLLKKGLEQQRQEVEKGADARSKSVAEQKKQLATASLSISKLKKELKDVKADPRILIRNNIKQTIQGMNALDKQLKALDGKLITVNVKFRQQGQQVLQKIQGRKVGGFVRQLEDGGAIPGFGGGDTVPALLEKGEIVLRKEAVKKANNRNLLLAINKGALDIRNLPTFQAGGLVTPTPVKQEAAGANNVVGIVKIDLNVGGSKINLFANRDEATKLVDVLREADRGTI